MLEDEQGNMLKDSALNFASVHQVLAQVDTNKEKYKWLHTIDEYGNSTFNHLQIPIIIAELEQLENEVGQDLQHVFKECINFMSLVHTHQYITFYGD